VLIVEDESRVRAFLAKGLREEGFDVMESADGPAALALMQERRFDLTLLDWMLPTKPGIDVLSALRERGDMTPVIMLTARDSLESRLEALNIGADDYVPKPFSFEEVLARIRAVLRRATSRSSVVLKCADLVVDPISRKVHRGGKEIRLTSREFSLLQLLAERQGQVQSRSAIVESVWEHDTETFSNVVEVYIRHLRQKVDVGFDRPLIHTVRGLGYVLKDGR
jgi:two-component system, OmpR family, copper resistance phosphate regulon response regulator CusR